MAKIKAVLLKPLDSDPIGAEREFSKAEFDKLSAQGAVKRVPSAKAAAKPTNKMAQKPANKSA
ncbi:hypothetical protein [Qipengyuania sp.]|uniref:hypothetical protein n=1 Tax=Qipengyuania sp. TaxID=2004515 RepID=UPI0035C87D58